MIAFVGIISVLWLIDVIVTEMEIEEILIGAFSNLCWCGVSVYIVCCCLVLFTIRTRLFMINRISKNVLTISEIKTISKLHMKLCEIASKNSKVFSFQMAITTGISITNGTLCIFELFIAIKDQAGGIQFFYSTLAMVTCIFFTILVALIMGTANIATSEGEKTLTVIHEGIYKSVQNYDTKKYKKIQILLLQLQHFNVNISCGFYKLDWKVMMMVSQILVNIKKYNSNIFLQVFSSTFSYLVVLIQSESLMKSKIYEE